MKVYIHSDRPDMHVAASLYIAARNLVDLVPKEHADVVINVDSIHNTGLARGKKTVYWELDDNLHQGKNEQFYDVDRLYIVSRENKHLYPPQTRVLPVAAEPTIHYDWGFPKEYDIVFIAELDNNPSYDYRRDVWSKVRPFFNVREGKCEPQNYPKELSKGKMLFNVNPVLGMNPPLIITRFFESMAIGCLLQDWHPTLDEFAKKGLHYEGFMGSDNAIDKAKYLLERPILRQEIARQARQLILDKHTWTHRLKKILEDL